MARSDLERLRRRLAEIGGRAVDFVGLAAEASDLLAATVPFDRSCWHTVDPGTVLLTSSVNFDVACSGPWLAEHEYVLDDVNQWATLARTGALVGTTSAATGGDLRRSSRHRSTEALGVGDELRASFVADGIYVGAVGLLRDADRPWFDDHDVEAVRAVTDVLGRACRHALVRSAEAATADHDGAPVDTPGLIIFSGDGAPEVVTPAAALWVAEMIEEPPPATPADSKVVQAVVAAARARGIGGDPLRVPSRARVRSRCGRWLVVHATALADGPNERVAVVIQQALPGEIAPVVALAHGLTARERDVARACFQGRSTKEIATSLGVTPYTVQDHLKSIFEKTNTRTRSELIGRVFLAHYVTRWEEVDDPPPGWVAKAAPEVVPPTAGVAG